MKRLVSALAIAGVLALAGCKQSSNSENTGMTPATNTAVPTQMGTNMPNGGTNAPAQ